MKDAGETPYPHKFHVTTSIQNFIETYASLKQGEVVRDQSVSVAGRIITKRANSKKLLFYDIHGEGEKLQIMANLSEHTDGDFAEKHAVLKRGDVIGVTGWPTRTKSKPPELPMFVPQ